MEYLLHHQVYCCGTIRSDRKYLPKNLKTEEILQGVEIDYCVYDGRLVFYKWKDNKVVTLLSYFHGTESVTVLRTQKDGRRINFNCPIAIKDYNTYMGGADKADMKFYYNEAPALVFCCEKDWRKNSATVFSTLVNGCF